MKLKKFTAKNWRGLKKVEIEPDTDLILIVGNNGAGKTSTLDGIKTLLVGKDRLNKKPIRKGEEKAELEADIGEYTIHRVFTKNSDRLEVFNKEGASYKSPQALLKSLTGGQSFDPNAFIQLPTKEQRNTLLGIVGVDLSELEERREVLYEERKMIGRVRDSKENYTQEQIDFAEKLEKKELVDIAEENSKMNKLKEKLEESKRIEMDFIGKNNRLKELRKEMLQLEIEIKELNEQFKAKDDMVVLEENIEKQEKLIETAETVNDKIRKAKRITEGNRDRAITENDYKEATKNIEKIDKEKEGMLKQAKMPIKGLAVADEGVYFNEVPLAQLSTSEKLRVGVSMYLAHARPRLPILFIENGNDLDEQNLTVLEEIAKESKVQFVIERIIGKKGSGFLIEDGEIKP